MEEKLGRENPISKIEKAKRSKVSIQHSMKPVGAKVIT